MEFTYQEKLDFFTHGRTIGTVGPKGQSLFGLVRAFTSFTWCGLLVGYLNWIIVETGHASLLSHSLW